MQPGSETTASQYFQSTIYVYCIFLYAYMEYQISNVVDSIMQYFLCRYNIMFICILGNLQISNSPPSRLHSVAAVSSITENMKIASDLFLPLKILFPRIWRTLQVLTIVSNCITYMLAPVVIFHSNNAVLK